MLVVPLVLCAILLSTCLAFGWLEQVRFDPDQLEHSPGTPVYLSPLAAVGQVWCAATFVAWFAMGIYLILSLLGTTLRAESHLGYWGPAVMLLLIFVICAPVSPPISTWYHAIVSHARADSVSLGRCRRRAESRYPLRRQTVQFGPVALSVAIQSALALLFVRRYGRKPRVVRAVRTKPAAQSRRGCRVCRRVAWPWCGWPAGNRCRCACPAC